MRGLTPAATVASLIEIIIDLQDIKAPIVIEEDLPGHERPRDWFEDTMRNGCVDEWDWY